MPQHDILLEHAEVVGIQPSYLRLRGGGGRRSPAGCVSVARSPPVLLLLLWEAPLPRRAPMDDRDDAAFALTRALMAAALAAAGRAAACGDCGCGCLGSSCHASSCGTTLHGGVRSISGGRWVDPS
jgi:hypothetical protein